MSDILLKDNINLKHSELIKSKAFLLKVLANANQLELG